MGVRFKKEKVDKSDFKFTEGFIQESLSGFFAPNSIKYDLDGLYVFDWESDKLLETRSGYIYEFEIKISKADFKNDFKHKVDKHIILEGPEKYPDKYLPKYYERLEESRKNGGRAEEYFHRWADESKMYLVDGHKRPNYFYYATPPDLIKAEDVPEYAGLAYINEWGVISIIKKAPCLHKEKISDADLNLGEKFYYNMDSWRRKCKKTKEEAILWREKFEAELDSKGQKVAYKDMEAELEMYKKSCQQLAEEKQKSNNQLHRDLYHQNIMVRNLARELQKYNPKFDFFGFEKELFGDVSD